MTAIVDDADVDIGDEAAESPRRHDRAERSGPVARWRRRRARRSAAKAVGDDPLVTESMGGQPKSRCEVPAVPADVERVPGNVTRRAGFRVLSDAGAGRPPLRRRPGRLVGYDTWTGGPGWIVDVSWEARRELLQAVADQWPDEVFGIAMGRRWRTPEGHDWTVVTAIQMAPESWVSGGPTSVSIAADRTSALTEIALARHPALETTGWVHSHGTLPAFLSSVDRRTQASWAFNGGIALVQGSDGLGVFVGPDGSQLQHEAEERAAA
jgi:proteasome lid subunit RPN8/RPN11